MTPDSGRRVCAQANVSMPEEPVSKLMKQCLCEKLVRVLG